MSINTFIAKCKKDTHKRVKKIISLTVEDFYNSGYSTDESTESLTSWLTDDISQIDGIENLNTYQISIMVLDKLKSLELVDLEFIHSILFANVESRDINGAVL